MKWRPRDVILKNELRWNNVRNNAKFVTNDLMFQPNSLMGKKIMYS